MSEHVAISPNEAADRLATRELVEAYAHCADRRDAKGQMSLFTADTHFVVYMNAKDPTPLPELHSREALAPVFAELNKGRSSSVKRTSSRLIKVGSRASHNPPGRPQSIKLFLSGRASKQRLRKVVEKSPEQMAPRPSWTRHLQLSNPEFAL